MSKHHASDLYLTAGSQPVMWVDGRANKDGPVLDSALTQQLAECWMNDSQRAEFVEKSEMNLAIAFYETCRFRVNIFRQKGAVGMVVRLIKTRAPTLDELQLPAVLKTICYEFQRPGARCGQYGKRKIHDTRVHDRP